MIDIKKLDGIDAGGLICGFRLLPDRAPVRLEAVPETLEPPGEPVWLHLSLSDMRARNWIASCSEIPEAGRRLLLGNDSHVRLSATAEHLFGVLGDLDYEFDTDPEKLGALYLYIDERFLITGRHHPIKATDQLRMEMNRCPEPVRGSFALLVRLLGQLVDAFDAVTRQLGDAIDDAEDRILRDRHHRLGCDLGHIRRVLARLRRHLIANRQALTRALPALQSRYIETEDVSFRTVVERLEGISHDIELVHDRARLLQEEIGRRLSEATSRNLYFLSIVTAIFLPVTLISGIFGMNVGGLPWVGESAGFWWVVVVMVATVLITLAILRWRRLF